MADEPFANVDPFTQAYRALAAALIDHSELAALIRLGNIVDYVSRTEHTIQGMRNDAGLPMLDIRPGGGTWRLKDTSTSSRVELVIDLVLMSDQELLDRELLPIHWQVGRAIAKKGLTLGLDWLTNIDLGDFHDEPGADPHSTDGWTRRMAVLMTGFFAYSQLTA